MNVFCDILNCRRAAQILAVLIHGLRNDLKTHIPANDQSFLESHASSSSSFLNDWLSQLSELNSWTLVLPPLNQQAIISEETTGISEHVEFLDHPFRPPFSWVKTSTDDAPVQKMVSSVRRQSEWACPEDAQRAILLFLTAVLAENTTVWVRNKELLEIEAAKEVLLAAELYSGHLNIHHQQRALQSTYRIGLLYEGLMGILGANTSLANKMFSTLRKVLDLLKERFHAYCEVMSSSTSSKPFMSSPKEFDDMLVCTGAFGDSYFHAHDQYQRRTLQATTVGTQIRNLYEKMAASKSNDFLETGIFAPDFPICRPSPSTSFWGTDLSHTEVSCSKEFNTHMAFSPGMFGGYCLCQHAKTVMLSFLKQPEGCRMPLNLIVERCKRLPRFVIYDFACGTQRAAVGLSSEISRHTSFLVDPFHFPGHKTCSLAMHESSYSELRGCNFESQEQRNSGIKVMERTLRASKDISFIHFVILAHGYQNLKAMFRDHEEDLTQEEQRSGWGQRSWVRWARDTLFSSQERGF